MDATLLAGFRKHLAGLGVQGRWDDAVLSDVLTEAADMGLFDQKPIERTEQHGMFSGHTPWVHYQGPHGGHGWRNTRTNRVEYQEEMPGAGEEGHATEEQAIAAQKPESQSADPYQSIKVGELGHVHGLKVRRTGENEWRLETDKGHVTGDDKQVQAHIDRQLTNEKVERGHADKAMARVEHWEEPDFFRDPDRAEAGTRAFEALPKGTRIVSLHGPTKGRMGSIVHDTEERGGKSRRVNKVKLDGEPGFASSYVEPLDAKLSWRVKDEDRQKKEPASQQGLMFSQSPSPESITFYASLRRELQAIMAGERLDMAQPEAIKKQFLDRYGPYSVYLVNAEQVRNQKTTDEDFGTFGTSVGFAGLIPRGEIWLANDAPKEEHVFYITNALEQLKEVDKGRTESEAYDRGLAREKKAREIADGPKPHAGPVPKEVYQSHWGTFEHEPIAVWLVNGELVRDEFKTDFLLGGNSEVYPWIPKGEIWISDTPSEEIPVIVLHEYTESVLMNERGLSYPHAHKIASKIEFAHRGHFGRDDALAMTKEKALAMADAEEPLHKADMAIGQAPRPTGQPSKWITYRGPRGGRGWRNVRNNHIVYQVERPGEDEEGHPTEEQARAAPGPAKQAEHSKEQPREPQHAAQDAPPTEADVAAEEDYKKNGVHAKAFKAWFGPWDTDPANASKVVNEAGEPQETHGVKKVYHGRGEQFAAFDKFKMGSHGSHAGRGFYFAENQLIAKTFADMQGGDVVEAYLNIKKPFDFDMIVSDKELDQWADEALKIKPYFNKGSFKERVNADSLKGPDGLGGYSAWHIMRDIVGEAEINTVLAQCGYDGLRHDSSDPYGSVRAPWVSRDYGSVWVAFEPNQIKSVANKGTFNPATDDINMALEQVSKWSPYVGPRGGRGWRDVRTNNILYQTERPGEHESGSPTEEQAHAHAQQQAKPDPAVAAAASPAEAGLDKHVNDLKALYKASIHPEITDQQIAAAVNGILSQVSANDAKKLAEAVDVFSGKNKKEIAENMRKSIQGRKGAWERAKIPDLVSGKHEHPLPSHVAEVLPRAKAVVAQYARPAEMSLANPWQRYQGPRGGHGWRNVATNRILYQDQQPGPEETGHVTEEQAQAHAAQPVAAKPVMTKPAKSKAAILPSKLSAEDKVKATELIQTFLGKDADEGDVASVVGALDDAKIAINLSKDKTALFVYMAHASFQEVSVRVIAKDPDGKTFIENKNIVIKKDQQGKGIGTQFMARQVEGASERGISYMRCQAARYITSGKSSYNGYYTWPLLGYDQPVDELVEEDERDDGAHVNKLKAAFPHAKTIQDVLKTEIGRNWWKKNGFDLGNARFDLSEGSTSRKILDDYLAKKKGANDAGRA